MVSKQIQEVISGLQAPSSSGLRSPQENSIQVQSLCCLQVKIQAISIFKWSQIISKLSSPKFSSSKIQVLVSNNLQADLNNYPEAIFIKSSISQNSGLKAAVSKQRSQSSSLKTAVYKKQSPSSSLKAAVSQQQSQSSCLKAAVSKKRSQSSSQSSFHDHYSASLKSPLKMINQ